MSTYFDVREKLIIDATVYKPEWNKDAAEARDYLPFDSAGELAAYGMQLRLANIGKSMLLGCEEVCVNHLLLVADGETYSFSGREITQEYQRIVQKLRESMKLDLTLDFFYASHGSSDLFDSEARDNMKVIADALKNERGQYAETMRGVAYQYWITGDENVDSFGFSASFGEINGHVYAGEDAPVSVARLPDADWKSAIAFVYDVEEPDEEHLRRSEALCRALIPYNASKSEPEIHGLEIYYPADALHIRSDEELRGVIRLTRELFRHPDYASCRSSWEIALKTICANGFARFAHVAVGESGVPEITLRGV